MSRKSLRSGLPGCRLNFKALIILMSSTFYIFHYEFKVGKAEKPWPND